MDAIDGYRRRRKGAGFRVPMAMALDRQCQCGCHESAASVSKCIFPPNEFHHKARGAKRTPCFVMKLVRSNRYSDSVLTFGNFA